MSRPVINDASRYSQPSSALPLSFSSRIGSHTLAVARFSSRVATSFAHNWAVDGTVVVVVDPPLVVVGATVVEGAAVVGAAVVDTACAGRTTAIGAVLIVSPPAEEPVTVVDEASAGTVVDDASAGAVVDDESVGRSSLANDSGGGCVLQI